MDRHELRLVLSAWLGALTLAESHAHY